MLPRTQKEYCKIKISGRAAKTTVLLAVSCKVVEFCGNTAPCWTKKLRIARSHVNANFIFFYQFNLKNKKKINLFSKDVKIFASASLCLVNTP